MVPNSGTIQYLPINITWASGRPSPSGSHYNGCSCEQNTAEESVKSALTSSRQEVFVFFPNPRAGLFSVKIQKKFLAINNFFVNETKSGQPNKRLFSLTFRELNGYFLLLRSTFFITIRPLAKKLRVYTASDANWLTIRAMSKGSFELSQSLLKLALLLIVTIFVAILIRIDNMEQYCYEFDMKWPKLVELQKTNNRNNLMSWIWRKQQNGM